MRIFFLTLFSCAISLLPAMSSFAAVVTFDDLSGFNGQSTRPSGIKTGDFYSGVLGTSGWTSGNTYFSNTVDPVFGSWDGWSYSNVVDSTQPGFMNQYAAFPGGGSNGLGGVEVGGTYAVAYFSQFAIDTGGRVPYFNLPEGFRVQSADFANTTYNELGILGNDGFNNTSTFGTGDFMRATFTGYQDFAASGIETGTVVLTLADYTAGQSFRLSNWTTTDMSGLGNAKSIAFVIEASNLNTPSYLAMDNLTITAVPEPGSLLMFGIVSLASITGYRRSRRSSFKSLVPRRSL